MIVYFNFPTMCMIAVGCFVIGYILGYRGRK